MNATITLPNGKTLSLPVTLGTSQKGKPYAMAKGDGVTLFLPVDACTGETPAQNVAENVAPKVRKAKAPETAPVVTATPAPVKRTRKTKNAVPAYMSGVAPAPVVPVTPVPTADAPPAWLAALVSKQAETDKGLADVTALMHSMMRELAK